MLQVVGAGLGRTGTASLKGALEQLLGGRCYHMLEVLDRPRDVAAWHAAVHGEEVDWNALLDGYSACVDWPAAAFWRELGEANPDALVLLSTRDSASEWWKSMEQTIVPTVAAPVPEDRPLLRRHREMVRELLEKRLTPNWQQAESAMAAYERHNEEVRRAVPSDRLLEWRPGAGWQPLCSALGIAVPQEAFPHENTTADFRARQGLDGST
jgi:Sulfotransferase domain